MKSCCPTLSGTTSVWFGSRCWSRTLQPFSIPKQMLLLLSLSLSISSLFLSSIWNCLSPYHHFEPITIIVKVLWYDLLSLFCGKLIRMDAICVIVEFICYSFLSFGWFWFSWVAILELFRFYLNLEDLALGDLNLHHGDF